MTTTNIPQAIQLYSRTPSGNEVVKRQGWCPDHAGKRSSKFLGPQPSLFNNDEVYWAFVCELKGKHVFLNTPDPTAPQDAKGIEDWKANQRLAWLQEKGQLQ